MDEKILTPDQVAQILQVHPFTVLKFIKQGKLRASKLGRVYRIRQSDVEKLLDDGEAPATAGQASPSSSRKEGQAPAASFNGGKAPAKTTHHSTDALMEAEPQSKSERENVQSESRKQQLNPNPGQTEQVGHYILDNDF